LGWGLILPLLKKVVLLRVRRGRRNIVLIFQGFSIRVGYINVRGTIEQVGRCIFRLAIYHDNYSVLSILAVEA
jgi:hypothetical protein